MKKLFVSVLVLALGFSVKAQDIPQRKNDSTRPQAKHGKMKKSYGMEFQKLNLTDAQKDQFKVQRGNFKNQMDELKNNEALTGEERKQKMHTIRKENKEKMEGLLTNDQKTQLKKLRADGNEKQKAMMQKKGKRDINQLNLTDEQSTQLKKHRAESMEKMKAIRENKSLSEEQKKAQMKELHKSKQESMKSILTADQLKKIKESKHKRNEGTKDKPSLQSKG